MQFKTADNTILNVEKNGQGPVLILVPGANGTGDIFRGVVAILAAKFTVITYDRRGYGASVLTNPLPAEAADYDNRYRLLTDANDVLELAKEFSPDAPSYLFGTSSGSIVAEQAFTLAPDQFARIAIHESPIMTVTAENRADFANQVALVDKALKGNFGLIQSLFADMHVAPLDAQMMGMDPNVAPDPAKLQPMLYWLKYEVLQYTGQTIDWQIFADNREKVVLLNGTDSIGFLPQAITHAIGETIGVPVQAIPGAHLGYAQKPIEFATTLIAVLTK
ncbi:alpha/beta hydrolase [Periweissella cryptocerci]|uniref:Alpha/beta hydrolase n=1 Tax=Periweissella cryptocerci TaxID=2506420 RepID=A0A4P6YR07_9LACO|nr:alpha/beta hydrolase [Periweissella cryptocerci]QBO35050.1 alpha/beta hydrolase [Periweissella cryptocerci]